MDFVFLGFGALCFITVVGMAYGCAALNTRRS